MPIGVPPAPTVYHEISAPADVALRLTLDKLSTHISSGIAVTLGSVVESVQNSVFDILTSSTAQPGSPQHESTVLYLNIRTALDILSHPEISKLYVYH